MHRRRLSTATRNLLLALAILPIAAVPLEAAEYVVDAALPLGGDCEGALGGSWNAATRTCVADIGLGFSDNLTIRSSVTLRLPEVSGNLGHIDNYGTLAVELELDNYGTLDNYGRLLLDGFIGIQGTSLRNFGFLSIGETGILRNFGQLTNSGLLVSRGELSSGIGGLDNTGGTILNLCAGTVNVSSLFGPDPIEGVVFEGASAASFSWCEDPGAGYELARGDLGSLAASGGDFAAALEECSGAAGTSLAYPAVPAPGTGVWFLVRPDTADGSWEAPGPAAAGGRDSAIAGSGVCP